MDIDIKETITQLKLIMDEDGIQVVNCMQMEAIENAINILEGKVDIDFENKLLREKIELLEDNNDNKSIKKLLKENKKLKKGLNKTITKLTKCYEKERDEDINTDEDNASYKMGLQDGYINALDFAISVLEKKLGKFLNKVK